MNRDLAALRDLHFERDLGQRMAVVQGVERARADTAIVDLATRTTERDAATATIVTRDATIATLTSQVADLTADVTTLRAADVYFAGVNAAVQALDATTAGAYAVANLATIKTGYQAAKDAFDATA